MSSSDEEPDHVCKPVLATAHGASWTECEICSKALPDAEPFQEEPADARGRASDKVEITRGRLAALEAIEEWAAGALAREAASVEPTLCAHPKGDGFCGEPVVPPGDACRDHEPTRLDVAAPPQGAGPGWDESTLTMLAEGALCVLEGRGLLRQMGVTGR